MSIHFRHHNVHQDNIISARRILCEQINNFLPICCTRYCHSQIFQQHRGKFGVQIIIFCQKHLDPLQVIVLYKRLCFFDFLSICQFHGNLYGKGRTDALPAVYCDRAAHQFNILL